VANRWVLSRWRKVGNDSAEVTSSDRLFHVCGLTSGKARLAMVVNLTGGTARWLVPAERRGRRPGKSATELTGPRYFGASPKFSALFIAHEPLRSAWWNFVRTSISATSRSLLKGHRSKVKVTWVFWCFLCAWYCGYPRTVLSLEQGLMILFVRCLCVKYSSCCAETLKPMWISASVNLQPRASLWC